MWYPYLKVSAKKAAGAVHVLDRYHIMAKLCPNAWMFEADPWKGLVAPESHGGPDVQVVSMILFPRNTRVEQIHIPPGTCGLAGTRLPSEWGAEGGKPSGS